MPKTVEFLFDFGSPTAYLAYTQLPRIAKETGAEIIWTPILLGGVFQAVSNQPPGTIAAKGSWMMADMTRFAARYGVPLAPNPHFPVNTLAIMRGAIWAQNAGVFEPYVEAMFKAMWTEGRNMSDPEEIASVLAAAGIDGEAFAQGIQDQAVKDRLKANTQGAVERGVFGAPSFFVDGVLHFGQDRLDFVKEALAT